MSAMTPMMPAPTAPVGIAYAYDNTGEVRCANTRGLTFFLFSEPVHAKPATSAAPASPAPAWQQVPATMEVEVRRELEPKSLAELSRTVPKSESPAIVAAPAPTRGTGTLVAAPAPGQPAPKGWFKKLFKG